MPVIQKKLAVIAGLAMLMGSQAQADVSCSTMTGGGISIEECVGLGGSYSMTNGLTGVSISEFFVSTQTTAGSDGMRTKRQAWVGDYLSESSFNASAYRTLFGTFDSLFGTADTGVFHYWSVNGTNLVAGGTSTGHSFFFAADPVSEFLAIGQVDATGDQRTYGSFVAPTVPTVPEPGSMALAALALAGLLVASPGRSRRPAATA